MSRTSDRKAGGSAAATPYPWLRPVPVVLILATLTILVYMNSLKNEFVFDDAQLIVGNPSIRDIKNLPKFLGLYGSPAYRPLRTASYAVDYFFFGLNPAGFRAVNILLHILTSTLVFFIFRALLQTARPALLAAILFAVHPIQTESVTYISGRRDILFALFYVAGFACYIRYRNTGRIRYLALTGFGYFLSLASKEMGITLPLLCVCYDVVRSIPTSGGTGPQTVRKAIAEGVRIAVRGNRVLYSACAAGLLFLAWYFIFRINPSQLRTMYGGGLGPTLMTSARMFVYYLKLLFLPTTLSADYSYNAFPVSQSLADPRVLFALAILTAIGWGIFRLLLPARWAAFGGLWFFITLLPVSQIIPHHEMMAEHYLYLPSAGIFLATALFVEWNLVRPERRAATVAAFTLVVALLGVRTVVRNRDWRNSETLWMKTVQTSPGSARVHINAGEIALVKGRFQQALELFQEAVRIQPGDAVNHDNLGNVLLRYGLYDQAEKHLRESLRIWPWFPKPRVNLGLMHLRRGQFDEAEREFRTALDSPRITQRFRGAILNNLGVVAALKGERDKAEQIFMEAVRLAPANVDARANLSKAYLEKGMAREGIAQLTEAVRLKWFDARLHYLLAKAYYEHGKKEDAALALGKALRLRTDYPEARGLLDQILKENASGQGRRG